MNLLTIFFNDRILLSNQINNEVTQMFNPSNWSIKNTLTFQEQVTGLNNLKTIVEDLGFPMKINGNLASIEGVKVYFNRDELITPFSLPQTVREVIKELNQF